MSEKPILLQPLSVQLEPEEWAELFDHINLAEQMIPGQERREHPRIDYNTSVTLYAEHQEASYDKRYLVRTRNVSASGVGFIHRSEIALGTRVRFTAFDPDGRVCVLEGESARAELVEDNVWDIGVRFDQLIDLSHLLDVDGQPLLQAG